MKNLDFMIKGSIGVPDDAELSPEHPNLIILSSGETIGVYPILEHNTGVGDDNHQDLTYDEGVEKGIYLEDYEREICVSGEGLFSTIGGLIGNEVVREDRTEEE